MIRKIIILVFLLFMSFLSNEMNACPGCKLASEPNNQNVVNVQKGFSYSVLFMLIFPMGLIAGVGHYSYQTLRKMEEERSETIKRKNELVS